MTLQEAFQKIKAQGWVRYGPMKKFEEYVLAGNEAAFSALTPVGKYEWWVGDLLKNLPDPPKLSPEDQRMLRAAIHVDKTASMQWFDGTLGREKADNFFEFIRPAFGKTSPETIAAAMLETLHNLQLAGKLTSAGRYVAELPTKTVAAAAAKADWSYVNTKIALDMVLDHAPQHVDALLAEMLPKCDSGVLVGVFHILMKRDGARFRGIVEEHCGNTKDAYHKAGQLRQLFDFAPSDYHDQMIAACRGLLKQSSRNNSDAFMAGWLIPTLGRELVPELEEWYRKSESYTHSDQLQAIRQALPADAVRLTRALAENTVRPDLRLEGLQALIALKNAAQDDFIEKQIIAGLGNADSAVVLKHLPLAGAWKPERLGGLLWSLMEHKSKQVRDAAARSLAKAGEASVEQAAKLLLHKRGEVRMAAASLLGAIGTERALAALEARLDQETNDDARDQMLQGLEAAWAKQGRTVTRKDIAKRMKTAEPKLQSPVAGWAKESLLPAVKWNDGKKLSDSEIRYMLYRQSRSKEMTADPEAKSVYALIDRKSSGDFALDLLKAFLASKQDAGDRWAMAVAGLLGDDRVVPLLVTNIRQWIENNRGKLAEYAVEALALLGSDAALLAVDALAIRYRSKMKNVGRAASEAFIRAAEVQGITPEELGDRVVPWLGFKKGEPFVVGGEGAKFEVRISGDFKLTFIDLQKNKPVKSLPKSVPAQVAAELKDMGANLREVIKAQTLRLENLLVRQRRWPAKRWRELFLDHPVLLPFATKLVWAQYDKAGKISGTFRALEDRSLTTNTDDTYNLGDGEVGMVHPLELSPEERQAWQTHLADYEVEPPFPQIGRSVVLVKPEEASEKVYKGVNGKTLNGMTFKGRAERLGWYRGSVVDGGGVSSYYKSFATAGADVIMGIDGMYMGMDMYTDVTCGEVRFVRANTVKRGSYVYDEPYEPNDPRIMKFGEVPAIVFSEAMGDLGKIVGEATQEQD